MIIVGAVPLAGNEGFADAADSSATLTTTTVTCKKIKGYFKCNTPSTVNVVGGVGVGSLVSYGYSVTIYRKDDPDVKLALASDPQVTEDSANSKQTISFETAATDKGFDEGVYSIKLSLTAKVGVLPAVVTTYSQDRTVAHNKYKTGSAAATCGTDGVNYYRCSTCGANIEETIPATNDHTWDSGSITKVATCGHVGETKYTCTKCGGTKTESIPEIKTHTWDSGRVTKAAKYLSTGIRTYTCEVCGTTCRKTIPKLNAKRVTPAKARLTSAKVSKKNLTVKWNRIAKNTKGYQICLKNKSNGKLKYYKVQQGKKKALTKTIKNLQKKKTYAVRIRAYNVIKGETLYGPWSNVKSGKVK